MPYPTAPKLQERIEALGLTASDGMVADALASAIASWESITGWRPFLSAVVSTKTITHTGGATIILPPGLALRSITSLQVAGSTTATDASKLILGNPTAQDSYRSITSSVGTYWGYSQISINGVWGLVADCPADVSAAILGLAVARLKSDSGSKGPLVKERVGDVEYNYGNYVTTDASKLAFDEFEAVANRYKVWSI